MTTKPIRQEIAAARFWLNKAIGCGDWRLVREALEALDRAETATHAAQTAHDRQIGHYNRALASAIDKATKAGVPGGELAQLAGLGCEHDSHEGAA